ncbi:hypothetical protein PQX77_007907 [Marasmius sp. AFHP31]|nr:hypothetical protein PQX77_007907 [Marasmius sp. AFHP31]
MMRIPIVHLLYPLLLFIFSSPGSKAKAPSGPWDDFNYAPSSRVVRPVSIRRTEGSVSGTQNLLTDSKNGTADIASGAWVTLDFGIEIGGLISMTIHPSSPTPQFALSFTESPQFISPTSSDDSSFPDASQTYDGVLPVGLNSTQSAFLWTQPKATLRGGFRFLTIASKSTLGLSNVTCTISFAPHVADMRNYSGYFWAKDRSGFQDGDFLTKSWFNNASLGVAGPIIVDGAKRDRAVWPGDMGIAVPTSFVSTNDLVPVRNALLTMFHDIASDGSLPESGPPLSQKGSDTYHGWTLIGCHNYHLYTGDISTIQSIWRDYTRAVAFLERKVIYPRPGEEGKMGTGLMNVTGLRDWARLGGGGINAEGNAILYQVLVTAAELAEAVGDTSLSQAYAKNATDIKVAFNREFWMNDVGLYRDNSTTTMAPQDANALAVLYNLTREESWKSRVSQGLTKNWRDLGPEPPELPDTISPFISGFELQAHFEADQPQRALDLLHRTWGYMLYTNLSVESTLLEGFTVNGSLSYRSYRGYNYDPAYTSHAHGWSSAPTSALTTYVLGLGVTTPAGKTWVVKPVYVEKVSDGGDGVKGGFETPLGWFGVELSWASAQELKAKIESPGGTSGVFIVPSIFMSLDNVEVEVDGKVQREDAKRSVALSGGVHSISVRTIS